MFFTDILLCCGNIRPIDAVPCAGPEDFRCSFHIILAFRYCFYILLMSIVAYYHFGNHSKYIHIYGRGRLLTIVAAKYRLLSCCPVGLRTLPL